jgi:hypothetical protein
MEEEKRKCGRLLLLIDNTPGREMLQQPNTLGRVRSLLPF